MVELEWGIDFAPFEKRLGNPIEQLKKARAIRYEYVKGVFDAFNESAKSGVLSGSSSQIGRKTGAHQAAGVASSYFNKSAVYSKKKGGIASAKMWIPIANILDHLKKNPGKQHSIMETAIADFESAGKLESFRNKYLDDITNLIA